jgi:uncharacterized iron-regulated membrane protein
MTVTGGSPTRVTWSLHAAAGFWLFAFVVMWGASGVYLGYPEPFAAAVDRYSNPSTPYGERYGDVVLDWATRLHFGRFDATAWQVAWVLLGLGPVLLAGTGVLLWWLRRPRRRASITPAGTRA